MKASDISEVRRLYRDDLEHCGIDRICGCYVNGDKEMVATYETGFLPLPEEEQHKYLELFRKVLSGTKEKNLLLLSPKHVHRDDGTGDTSCDEIRLLQALVETGLQDEETRNRFFSAVVEHFQYADNYLILLAHQNYDVPGKTSDDLLLDDASEEVYSHILCAICPVKPTKPGLGYDPSERTFHNLEQGRIVELPMNGFLFPAFIDRSQDPDFVLYYTKDTVDIRPDLANGVLGSSAPLAAAGQKEAFSALITESLGEESDLDTVLGIHDGLRMMLAEKKAEEETPVIDRKELGKLLRSSGVNEEQVKTMEEHFDDAFTRRPAETAGEEPEGETDEEHEVKKALTAVERYPEEIPVEERIFVASNLMSPRSLEVKNSDFTIRINTSRTELLETKVVDGKKCLLIRLDDGVTVNGIPVRV